MRKRLVAIYSVLVAVITLLAVFVPSCTPPAEEEEGGGECTIEVKATLDGADSPSSGTGAVTYTLTGPGGSSPTGTTSVPKSFTVDPGSWTCVYVSGGPPGAYLDSITPSATQSVSAGGTITFTFNFKTTPTQGTIEVKATLDGSPWTGAVQYTLTGPGAALPISGTEVPDSFTVDCGSWTSAYVSGGPAGASFVNITPSATQTVSAGGTITFTLNLKTIPLERCIIEAKATLDGSPWIGAVQYTLTGPGGSINGTAVPATFSNVDCGNWTCAHVSGGPGVAGGLAYLASITPSTTQSVSAGGTITFTLNFRTSTIRVIATVISMANPQISSPWTGAIAFNLTGPGGQTIFGYSVPLTYNVSAGNWFCAYISGGPIWIPPYGAHYSFRGITPGPIQTLFTGGTITFSLDFWAY